MESGMPHQDKEDLRTPLDQLKEVLGPVTSADLKGVKRHGNSVIDGPAIAMLALLTFGWGRFKTLGERFAVARDATTRLLPCDKIAVSLCMHLTTCLPFLWNTGGSADSERGLLLGMLDRLPAGSRLVMDAYYFGFEFWNRLIE